MGWNEDQLKAIEIRGSDILVAAGAGSGKTAVLVERIARRILPENGEPPLDIDRLLVVTFTKAAAAEMRQRLFDILRDRLDKASGDEYRRIYTQQKKISKARISTIHSFCHSVINENASESGIDSSYRLISDSTPDKMKGDIADSVLEEMSRNNRETYLRLTDIYGTWKSDERLKKIILDVVKFADNFSDPVSKIREFTDAYKAFPDNDFVQSPWGRYLKNYLRKQFEYITGQFEILMNNAADCGFEKISGTFEKDVIRLRNAVSVLSEESASWNEISGIRQNLIFDKFCGDKDIENAKEICESFRKKRDVLKKKVTDSISDRYLIYTDDDFEAERALVYPDIAAISGAAIEVLEKYAKLKKKRKILDFSDLEHIAFRLLSDECIAGRYRSLFDEIYIDEYQDTNEVQNLILKLVSGGKSGVGNRFMVGDVKQSIYSFRQARPDIFTDKYNRYSAGTDGQLVRLNKNYRCRREVIDFTNSVFEKIMNQNTCRMNYGDKEKLIFGAEDEYFPPESDAYNYDCEVICAAGRNSDEARINEAKTVAEKIREIIASGMIVGKKMKDRDDRRPVTFGDICILVRSTGRTVENLMKILPEHGIPVVFDNSGNLYDYPEFLVIMSFLRILDNPRQDIYLISVLKNIYGFSDNLLSQIKLSAEDRKSDFFTAFDSSEQAECICVRNRINELRFRARNLSVSEIVWKCMHENGFFDRLSSVSGGDCARQNLMQLFGMAASADGRDNPDLGGFIGYIDTVISMKGKMSGIPLKTGNSVRIMTIHGSKGLEFPVVILFGTGNERNDNDEEAKFVCSREMGFGAQCYDRAKKLCYPSVMKFIISDRLKEESKAEEMRILYVALTRSKEKLIVTGHIPKGISPDDYLDKVLAMSDGKGHVQEYAVYSSEKYIDLICASVLSDYSRRGTVSFAEPGEEQEESTPEQNNPLYAPLPSMPLYTDNTFDSLARFQIGEADDIPSKISVSDIRRLSDPADDNHCVKLNSLNEFQDENLSAARKGTLLHLAIEHIDFGKIFYEHYADELIMTLEDRGFITEEEGRELPSEILAKFMKSDFAGRIAGADKLMREVPFTVTESYRKFGIDKDGSCAIQGIIDCVFFEQDRIILVDFKSDSVYDNYTEYSEKYSVQLEIYAEAVRRAFGKYPDETYLYYLKNNHLEKMSWKK